MKKTGFWVAVICIFLLASISAAVLLYGGTKHTAEITLDGNVIRTVDLNKDDTFTIQSKWGENTIVVENGTIRVDTASCPDHVCVEQGACSGGIPIVCLPNRLVIRFMDSAAADAVSG